MGAKRHAQEASFSAGDGEKEVTAHSSLSATPVLSMHDVLSAYSTELARAPQEVRYA